MPRETDCPVKGQAIRGHRLWATCSSRVQAALLAGVWGGVAWRFEPKSWSHEPSACGLLRILVTAGLVGLNDLTPTWVHALSPTTPVLTLDSRLKGPGLPAPLSVRLPPSFPGARVLHLLFSWPGAAHPRPAAPSINVTPSESLPDPRMD